MKALRSNIKIFAANSADAKKAWIENKDLDAWVIWNIWQVANPELAQTVEVERDNRIYRDTGVVLTERGKKNQAAIAFQTFLQSTEARDFFANAGWIVD